MFQIQLQGDYTTVNILKKKKPQNCMVLKGKEEEQKGRENQSELHSYEIDFIKVGTQAKQQRLRKNKAARKKEQC